MACFVQLGSGSESSRPRAYYRDSLSASKLWRISNNPAFFKALVGNCTFDILDGNRWFVNGKYTGAFARSRTHAASELGKVVGLMQAVQCVLPMPVVNQIIPFWNEVIDGTAIGGLTKRDAAVHAPGSLFSQMLLAMIGVYFVEIQQPLHRISIGLGFALKFLKSCWLSHLNSWFVKPPTIRQRMQWPVRPARACNR